MLIGLIIFAVAFVMFLLSPVRSVADSKYSLVVSQSLLSHRSFALDHYAIPRLEPKSNGAYVLNGDIYQQEWVGGRLYYYLPPGSSVLSVPYVAVMNLFGLSVVNEDGTYNIGNEVKLQAILASLLMALLASIFFFTSRLVLPPGWSVLMAIGGTLGTQVWSTASRALWSDTWGIFLLGLVVWMLLAEAAGKARWRPVLLASLLAWSYFVRPTNAIPIFAITVYILIYQRRLFVRYAAAGFIWFALFVAYSWYHFGQVLPNYYLASRLTFNHLGEALAGNLISPARGLFIYVPVLFYIFYLLARYRKKIAFPRLVWLALSVIVVHWIVSSGFPHWWGGHSYGPRLMAGVIPWFVLLGILGVQAMLKACAEQQEEGTQTSWVWRMRYLPGTLLLLISIAMNGIGATSQAASMWNAKPIGVDKQPGRIWDWRRPQFLAWFLGPPLPQVFPPAGIHVEFSRSVAEPYLWYGWSANEELFRWTDAQEAAVIFALDEITDTDLRIKLAPLIVPGQVDAQRIYIQLNGHLIDTLTLRDSTAQEYSWKMPKGMLRQRNTLIFGLPDAVSPKSLNLSADPRDLGIAVYWLEIQPQNPGGARDNQAPRATTANAPLPAGGYNADVQAIDPPTELKTGEQANLRVKVRNISGAIWPVEGQSDGTYQLRLGNHWLNSVGHTVMLDDARAALPFDLRPGTEVELLLTINAPQVPGDYILELDMVQERVTWFADEGSHTTRMKITVR